MAVSKALVHQVRQLDEYELRRLLILVRGLLLHVDGPPRPDQELGLPPSLTYRQERVRCGKPTCGSCPHGPYWYGYWKQDGRTRKRYIGRHLPGEPLEAVIPDTPAADTAPSRPAGSGARPRVGATSDPEGVDDPRSSPARRD